MKKNQMGKACAALLGIVALAMGASSQEKKESTEAHKIVHFGDLKWTPIIKGCDLAPVSGDFNAEGAPFVLRLRCADGTKIPAHWHPTDENVTVLKGTFRKQTANDERRKLCFHAQGDAALCHEQGRNDRAGPRHGPVQSELGESVGSAAAGCAGFAGEAEALNLS